MNLDRAACDLLLEGSGRGVLATRHPWRGVDAVPVCFAVAGARLGVPVDTVKPKASADLQRERNLDDDPRAALLCDHWDPADWSQLWWVRVTLDRVGGDPDERSTLESLLERKYPQYLGRPFARLLVFEITAVSGWSAAPG